MKLTKYKLGELLDVKRGASLAGEYYATEGEYVRLTCGNFDYVNNCFKENTSKDNLFYTGKVREEFIMQKGDIITPLTEQAIGLLGSTAIIPESNKYIQSQDVAKIICNEELLYPMYAFYLISSDSVKAQLGAAAQQTKIRHTSPDKIKDCVVWIPDLDTQRRIASVLSNLDRKIALNRQTNTNLEALARQLYDYWFVQFDFPDANGKPYKSSGGKMVYNPQLKREIPKGWEVDNLGNLFEAINERISPDDIRPHERYTPIEVIPRHQMSFSESSPIENAISGLCRYKKDDILLSNRRVYFHKVSIAPLDGITRDTVIILRAQNKQKFGFSFQTVFDERFIKFATMHSYGSEQPVLSWTSAKEYNVVKPTNDLDAVYSALVQPLIEQVISNHLEIVSLTRQRDELLPLLMNGQVMVE